MGFFVSVLLCVFLGIFLRLFWEFFEIFLRVCFLMFILWVFFLGAVEGKKESFY